MNRILIVDDNSDILQVMQILLASRGFEVEVTTKGDETFEKIDSFQPNLILLDIHLSGIDGRDICRTIKTSDEFKDIPVILFSSNRIKGTKLAETLADEFVAKPFDIHELISKINHFIGVNDDGASMTA